MHFKIIEQNCVSITYLPDPHTLLRHQYDHGNDKIVAHGSILSNSHHCSYRIGTYM